MIVIEYSNPLLSSELALYWEGSEYYPKEVLDEKTIELLNDVNAIRVWIPGAGLDRNKYDDVFDQTYNFLFRFLFEKEDTAYLFKVEDSPKIPNRVRSYKGLLPKRLLEENTYSEKEFTISDRMTLIVSEAKITRNNFHTLINLIGDRRYGFILVSSGNKPLNVKTLSRVFKQ